MSPNPPGWYPDPNSPGYERYWSGKSWTTEERVAPGHAIPERGIYLVSLDGKVLGGHGHDLQPGHSCKLNFAEESVARGSV